MIVGLDSVQCIFWSGPKDRAGYGRISIGKKRRMQAHRWAYEQIVGPLASDLHLHHLCGNKLCINSTHLKPLSNSEHRNYHPKRLGIAIVHAAKTTCPRGHEYDYAYPDGRRGCKRCAGWTFRNISLTCPKGHLYTENNPRGHCKICHNVSQKEYRQRRIATS